MDVSLEDFKDWFPVLTGVVTLAVTALIWRLRGEFASKGDIRAAETRLGALEDDVTAIQSQMSHLPDHDDLAEVRRALTAVEGSVNVVSTEVAGLREVLTRVERPLNLLLEHHLSERPRR